MIIQSLQFEDYRNLSNDIIIPHEGVNVIYGQNAQGKTNILEGIWLLSGNKSFRGAKDKEAVKFGNSKALIKAGFFSENREQEIELAINNGKREVKLNGVKKALASDIGGKLCMVVFSPEQLSLVKSGPAERRIFIDSALCQIRPKFYETLRNYSQTLSQRNALLKDIPEHPELLDTLDAWDWQLAMYGVSVMRMRMNYVEQLCKTASEYHLGISENKEQLELKYHCSFDADDYKNAETLHKAFLESLSNSRSEDISRGYTTVGPHRDDMEININNTNVKLYGSQGQQRSCVLSIKIAEAELIKMAIGQEPIVLLDDVLSELDSRRQEFLLNKITDRQVFISCCELESVKLLKNGKCFEIINGHKTETNVR